MLILADRDIQDSKIIAQTEIQGSYGVFTLDQNGQWFYELANDDDAVQILAENEAVTDSFTIMTSAGISDTVTVNISGRYDPLILTPQNLDSTEGDELITGQLSVAQATYSLIDSHQEIAGFILNSDGSYSFDPNDNAYNSMTADDAINLSINYQATNNQGESGTSELTITLLGSNDIPALVQSLNNLSLIIGNSFSYQIDKNSFSDPDYDDPLSYQLTLANGDPIPQWLEFDPESFILTGRVQASDLLDSGLSLEDNLIENASTEVIIRLTATDTQGNSSHDDIAITLISEGSNIISSSENDLLYGSEQDDDVALVSFLPGQYIYNEGQLTGAEGDDSLTNIEYIGFGYNYGEAYQVDVLLEDLEDPDGIDGPETSYASQLMDKISDLYIAYFGRAPDTSGFTYWFKEVYTNSHSFEDAARAFSYSQEYQDNYPEGTSNRDFIEKVYINLFNREPDTGGWDYWEGRLDDGLARDTFLLSVINGAYAPTSGEEDRSLLGNKHDVSVYYAEQSAIHPDEGFDEAINLLLNQVTDDTDTALSAIAIIDHAITNEITLGGIIEDQSLFDQLWG